MKTKITKKPYCFGSCDSYKTKNCAKCRFKKKCYSETFKEFKNLGKSQSDFRDTENFVEIFL